MKSRIQVPLDDVIRMFLLLEDLNSFFHDPRKYGNVDSVIKFVENGTYQQIHAAYYYTVWNWLPKNVQEEMLNRPSPFEQNQRD